MHSVDGRLALMQAQHVATQASAYAATTPQMPISAGLNFAQNYLHHAPPQPQGYAASPAAPIPGDSKKALKISRKFTESLTKLDGKHGDYALWKERMMDHIADPWPKWKGLLEAAERTTTTITYEMLNELHVAGHFQELNLNGDTIHDLSLDLWYFISKWIGPKIYERRNRTVGDQRNTGFELW